VIDAGTFETLVLKHGDRRGVDVDRLYLDLAKKQSRTGTEVSIF